MENSLLERERMDRMLEAGTVEEAAKVLTECGYPELQAVNVDTVDAMLAQAREELFGTLNDLAPNVEILDVFKVDVYKRQGLHDEPGQMAGRQHHLLRHLLRWFLRRLYRPVFENLPGHHPETVPEMGIRDSL